MKILITGAFGNLGTLVLDRLLAQGHEVTAFDLKNPINEKIAAAYSKRLALVWGDIRDDKLVFSLVEGHNAVIHLAALIAPFSESNPALAFAVNVSGTRSLLNAVEQSPFRPLFIFSSSFAVFGLRQNDPPPRTVNDPLLATDQYSEHKIACEKMIQASSCNWLILRFGAMVDARMRHSSKQQLKLSLDLAANNRVEYIHPQDAATAIVNALSCPLSHRKVLLIGGGQSCQVTHLELMNALVGAMGIHFKAIDLGQQQLYADWVDSTESQVLLNYQHHSFDDFRRENYAQFKWLRLLLRPFSPLVKFCIKLYARYF